MPNINDAFPSKYVKASDLKGAEQVVTIDHVDEELVGRDKEKRLVAYFRGRDKGFVMNKTNAKKIAQLLDTAVTEEWSGHRIKLYPTETEFAGETVECIRVKAAPSANGARAATPPPPSPPRDAPEMTDDDIPF